MVTEVKVKIKYEDLEKAFKYLDENCKGGYVTVSIQHPTLTFDAKNFSQENRTLILTDDEYYISPRLIIEDNLWVQSEL